MSEPRPPAPRQATIRQALAETLRHGEYTAPELSQLVGLPEKAVADHLAHIARSLPALGMKLILTRPACLNCGYSFKERSRLTRPSRSAGVETLNRGVSPPLGDALLSGDKSTQKRLLLAEGMVHGGKLLLQLFSGKPIGGMPLLMHNGQNDNFIRVNRADYKGSGGSGCGECRHEQLASAQELPECGVGLFQYRLG